MDGCLVSWDDKCQVVSVGHVKDLLAVAQRGFFYDVVVS